MREDRIAALAHRQHGVISHNQLEGFGVSTSAIGRRVTAGRLRALHRGVYRLVPLNGARAPEWAAVLLGGTGAVISHTSAASLWGLLPIDPPRPVHITLPRGGRSPRCGVVLHRTRTLSDDEREEVEGMPVTAPARTIVDLAGVLGRREIELALATAEREGLVEASALDELPERYARRPGIAMLRSILESEAEARFTRSEAERRCLRLLREAGLPRPHPNVSVGPYELDLLWPGENVAIEIDGYRHHRSRARFEGDRLKDNWLRARGISVVRLTWRQITEQPTRTAVLVGQALAGARALRTPGGAVSTRLGEGRDDTR